MTEHFDERAGLIRRYRAEGGLPDDSDERHAVHLSAEEREEHEAAEAVRKVEEMIRREKTSGVGGGDDGDNGLEDDGEIRQRYWQGMHRFEREERWSCSPSIKWTDCEEDVRNVGDENYRGRQRRRLDDKVKDTDRRLPGNRSPAPLGFGKHHTNSPRQGLWSGADVAMLGGDGVGESPPPPATRSPWEVKGKAKMAPQDWDERPGKGMLGEVADPLDDIYAAGSDEEEDEDERTRDRLMRAMRGGHG